eukprot:8108640-Pyramimonas_sp.AAC.1
MAAFSTASVERRSACSSSNSSRRRSTRRMYSGRSYWTLAPWRGADGPKPISFTTWNPRALLGRDPPREEEKDRAHEAG